MNAAACGHCATFLVCKASCIDKCFEVKSGPEQWHWNGRIINIMLSSTYQCSMTLERDTILFINDYSINRVLYYIVL